MRDRQGIARVTLPWLSREVVTAAYIVAVWVLAGLLGYIALSQYGAPRRTGVFVVTALLAVVSWRAGISMIESRVQFSAGHIAVLSAVGMLQPVGAGLVGLIMTLFSRGPLPVRNRIFNVGMWAAVAWAGGITYQLTGGVTDSTSLTSAGPLLVHVGLPLVAVDLVMTLLNALLLSGVIRLDVGTPIRVQMARLLSGSGLLAVGYGVVAFLLVVLWLPAGMGPYSVLLILAPMLGAWWAYRQYGEERAARQRTLDVLVAAIETKAPHLSGHSARVAELCGAMAEHLGMRPHDVRDTRNAGMLHDVGQVALPRAVVAAHRGDDTTFATYPARGAHILREVSFLAGSLDGIAHHRDGRDLPQATTATPGGAMGTSARVVRAAHRFDMLTRMVDDERLLSPLEALERLRRDADQEDLRIVDALVAALARHPGEADR